MPGQSRELKGKRAAGARAASLQLGATASAGADEAPETGLLWARAQAQRGLLWAYSCALPCPAQRPSSLLRREHLSLLKAQLLPGGRSQACGSKRNMSVPTVTKVRGNHV